MSTNDLKDSLKNNWYLLLGVVGLFAGAAFMGVFGSDDADEGIALAARPETAVGSSPGSSASSAHYADPNRFWKKPTKRNDAENDLERYESDLAEQSEGKDAAVTLVRMGNVCYSKLQDYDKAAACYERVLKNHPEYDINLHNVYANLGACYERLKNRPMARNTYHRMIKYFGSGSQEALFAEQQMSRL